DQHVPAAQQLLRDLGDEVFAIDLDQGPSTELRPERLRGGYSAWLRAIAAPIRRNDGLEHVWLIFDDDVSLREHRDERVRRHSNVDRIIDGTRTRTHERDARTRRLRERTNVACHGHGWRHEREQYRT